MPPGTYDVVDEVHLAQRSKEGWQLEAVLPCTVQETASEEVLGHTPPTTSSAYGANFIPTARLAKPILRKTHKYLIRFDPESALALVQREREELQGRLDAALKEMREATDLKTQAEKRVVEAVSQAKTASIGRDGAVNDALVATQQARAATEKLAKADDTLGYVWQKLGDVTMKGILGGSATNPRPGLPDERRTVYDRLATAEDDEGVHFP